jgi:hypothetical protein
MNSVALIGRLTADPTTHAGETHESATFRLAVPRPGSDAAEFLELVSQLFHADVLMTERVGGIEALEADVDRLRAALEGGGGV